MVSIPLLGGLLSTLPDLWHHSAVCTRPNPNVLLSLPVALVVDAFSTLKFSRPVNISQIRYYMNLCFLEPKLVKTEDKKITEIVHHETESSEPLGVG
ncbi:hypothetical protein E2C01_037006 [Portunus trituberculatus]|uniref:Uncharacterized protein n=1 Tax=Portunus trituberculatus TaxID=210409 RepID=A0A5B7FA95_PORTR|nr:hypothetical protein [Portunus trituberculatus]